MAIVVVVATATTAAAQIRLQVRDWNPTGTILGQGQRREAMQAHSANKETSKQPAGMFSQQQPTTACQQRSNPLLYEVCAPLPPRV